MRTRDSSFCEWNYFHRTVFLDEIRIFKINFFIFSWLAAFLLLVLQLHFCADWLPIIRARQPSGLWYKLLLTAAYPTRVSSKYADPRECSSIRVDVQLLHLRPCTTRCQSYKSFTGPNLQVCKYRAIFNITCSH